MAAPTRFSKLYLRMIDEAEKEFVKRLSGHKPIAVDKEKFFRRGWDALPVDIRRTVRTVFGEFLNKKRYELSYNQMNVSLFRATQKLGILKVR